MNPISRDKLPTTGDAKSTTVRLVVLFSAVPEFDPRKFAELFQRLWNKRISCDQAPTQRDLDLGIRRYEVDIEGARLSLALIAMPLPKNVIDVIDRMTSMSALPFQISVIQSKALKEHATHAIIETTVTENLEKPMEGIACAWAMIELVLTLMEQFEGMVGYAPASAQVYHPKEWLRDLVRSRQIQQSDLFILLCNMHFIANSENWVHTHGMEQFGLPDIEARFPERDKASQYTNLVGDAAMYTIETAVISVGDTLELSGNGETHRVVEAREVPEHSYGVFGAIGIEKM